MKTGKNWSAAHLLAITSYIDALAGLLSNYPVLNNSLSMIRKRIDIIKNYYAERNDGYNNYIDLEDIGITELDIQAPAKHSRDFADLKIPSVADRLALLDKHVGRPISNYVCKLFPELAVLSQLEAETPDARASRVGELDRSPLPEKAPALWAEAKEEGDTPPAFIQRHYASWLGNGLTRADVRRLDPQLYMALSNWLRKNELPEGFDLPTLKERNDRWVERVRSGAALPDDPAALHRLGAAMRHRQASKP